MRLVRGLNGVNLGCKAGAVSASALRDFLQLLLPQWCLGGSSGGTGRL